jgi:putative transposase
LSVAGYPHHVIQRGNDRDVIFGDVEDYRRFLESLREVTKAAGIAVHAYVLMPNHVHLLMTPPDEVAIGRTMQAISRRYVRWFNDRHARTGALFEGRYRSTVVEADRYLLACMRYIELNPVRAEIVQRPEQYPWSSYRHHAGLFAEPAIVDHPLYWSLGNTPFERQASYMRLFEQDATAAELDHIRAATHGGWALGDRGFAAEIAKRADRRSQRRKAGRPKSGAHSVPN